MDKEPGDTAPDSSTPSSIGNEITVGNGFVVVNQVVRGLVDPDRHLIAIDLAAQPEGGALSIPAVPRSDRRRGDATIESEIRIRFTASPVDDEAKAMLIACLGGNVTCPNRRLRRGVMPQSTNSV